MLSFYSAPGIRPYDLPNKIFHADDIMSNISDYTGIGMVKIKGRDRRKECVYARHLCVYFIRKKTDLSWKEIGAKIGGKDHTSAIHAYHSIKNLFDVDEIVQRDVNYLMTVI